MEKYQFKNNFRRECNMSIHRDHQAKSENSLTNRQNKRAYNICFSISQFTDFTWIEISHSLQKLISVKFFFNFHLPYRVRLEESKLCGSKLLMLRLLSTSTKYVYQKTIFPITLIYINIYTDIRVSLSVTTLTRNIHSLQ